MRIIYVIGSRLGASLQASRILPYLKNHEVKLAGYVNYSEFQPYLDWTLDALYFDYSNNVRSINRKLLQVNNLLVDTNNLYTLLNQVKDFSPDLIINDFDYYFSVIANSLGIEWWLLTPILLIRCFESHIEGKYFNIIDTARDILKRFNPDKQLIYSSFGDLKSVPDIKLDRQWIRPYYQEYKHSSRKNIKKFILNDSCLLSFVQSDLIADLIYNNKQFLISPQINDAESCINANYLEYFGVSYDLGQIELMKEFAQEEYDKYLNKVFKYKVEIKSEIKQLHELL